MIHQEMQNYVTNNVYGSEIKSDKEMILLLSKMNAEERLAAFYP